MNKEQKEVPKTLLYSLQKVLTEAKLRCTQLPDLPIQLWLISEDFDSVALSSSDLARLWSHIPYWIFCWASGLSLAKWLLQNPQEVVGKTVLDFGSGSGVVAIAAKLAGAKKVIACDIDTISLLACKENAHLNNVTLEYLDDIYQQIETVDVLLAADVLYDLENRFFLDVFLEKAHKVIVADSRVRNFHHPHYQKTTMIDSTTWPDLDEAKEFRHVSVYASYSLGSI